MREMPPGAALFLSPRQRPGRCCRRSGLMNSLCLESTQDVRGVSRMAVSGRSVVRQMNEGLCNNTVILQYI